jgi:hypothetical protein
METEQTVDTDLVVRWIEALESGDYAQGCNVLRTSSDKMCCLGVLLDIVDPTQWRPATDEDKNECMFAEVGMVWGDERNALSVPVGIMRRVGLKGTEGNQPWTINKRPFSALSAANDFGASFADIAAALRDYYGIPKEVDSAA